jgi:hypothetical protein
MSKDLFLQMREQEIATTNFLPTKKELIKSSKDFAKNLLDEGNINIKETYAQALRLKESLTAIEAVLKSALGEENFEEFGLSGNFRNGGDTTNFKDDVKWLEIKASLTHRESLLKTALKSDILIYDEEGIEVSKVSKTPRKSSLAISF